MNKKAPITGHAQGQDIHDDKVIRLVKKQPEQLALFQTFLPEDDKYSNTIEFYDAIPKYFTNKRQVGGLREGPEDRKIYLPTLKCEFSYKDVDYILETRPARVENRNGDEVEYYPSEQEELVEEALRKLACDRLNGVFLEDEAGVQFTMYELREELRKKNHTMSHDELKRSLLIGRRASICVKRKHGDTQSILDTSIFPIVMISERHEYIEDPKNTFCYVQFNTLVTQSIKELTYRQFDYETFMGYNYQLSRWFHKRLYHRFTNASIFETYSILYSTIKCNSRLLNNNRVNKDIQYLERTLEELKEKGVIFGYEKEVRRGSRNRIIDVLYGLRPSIDFIGEMKKANKRAKEIKMTSPIRLEAYREK